jgi:hypothetical protein
MKARLRDMGYLIFRTCEKVFSGESSVSLTPMAAIPAGCGNPLEGVVVGTFYTLGLRVNTFDFGLDDGGVARRYPLGRIIV